MAFLHGLEVLEVETGGNLVKEAGTSTIGLAGFVAEDMLEEVKAGLHLVTSTKDAAKFGTENPIALALRAIFLQTGAKVVISLVEPVKTKESAIDEVKSQTALIGGAGDAYTGIQSFLDANSKLGVKPKILISEGSDKKPVAEALLAVAQRLRAIAIIDTPNSFEAAINYAKKQVVSDRAFLVAPRVISDGKEQALSPFVAGVMVKNDMANGAHVSPSNQKINGIDDLSLSLDFALGDSNCRVNILNENHIATLINEQGIRLWGNHTSSDSEKWRYLSIRRVADLINDSIMKSHLWAVDRNITKAYFAEVEANINAFLRDLKSREVIINGECKVNTELTNSQAIAEGRVTFDVEFSSYYTAEHITFRSILTDKYIKEIL